MKKILVINGSASANSSNERLIDYLAGLTKDFFNLVIFNDLKTLPHFDPGLSAAGTPKAISDLRRDIETADGLLICTPEYIFSIPSGLKNAIEWCISTTVFSDKPVGLITASANGEKGHEELQLIMKTAGAKFTTGTTLLVQGIKGKLSQQGHITDIKTAAGLAEFVTAFKALVNESPL